MTSHPPSYGVLAVDDEPDILRLWEIVFERTWAFHLVGKATDGLEAISVARATQPDVILLDLLMPRMSGIEAFPHLRSACPEAKIIACTMVPERCEELPGRDGCLEKGQLPSQLVFNLYHLLNPDHSGPVDLEAP